MADTHLIEEWKSQKGAGKKRIRKFLNSLKSQSGKHLDKWANEVHDEVFSEMSCMDCANCCSSIPPIVNRTDARRIARHLGMGHAEFESTYLTVDEDGDTVMNTTPCPFLQADNACEIYEVRPRACREYPHTDDFTFSRNIRLHQQNAQYCPAVFHILKRMQERF